MGEGCDSALTGVVDPTLTEFRRFRRLSALVEQYLHLQFEGSRWWSVNNHAACGTNSMGDLNCFT